jgi:DGQHR domain-containing protein
MSNMTAGQLRNAEASLQRPGWLPTAVVVNILAAGEVREGLEPLRAELAVGAPDLDGIEAGSAVELSVPSYDADDALDMTPPFEVIDGQHRLWAFEDDEDTEDFYLPVVAFLHLDRNFQAYLFWSINIKPKKINTSLAFDLYPMLRSQDWLIGGEGLKVYRESRAQELTEALWASAESPWYDRINMIGAKGVGDKQPVSQASFVRSLMASFVKPWDSRFLAGGLYGHSDSGGLDWNRAQQAAFLIAAWQEFVEAVGRMRPVWYRAIAQPGLAVVDVALGRQSMLASDQGVRAFMLILNEVTYLEQEQLGLSRWLLPPSEDSIDPEQVAEALASLDSTEIRVHLRAVAEAVATFDWRSSKAPGVRGSLEKEKAIYRGSGGYVALRRDVYKVLLDSSSPLVKRAAKRMLTVLADDPAQDAGD